MPASIRILQWFLLVVAIHTFGVGVTLIVSGDTIMTFFGFSPLGSRFFQMQGGVFHLIVSYVYYKAGTDPKRYEYLIVFSVVIKMTATVFLFSYYFFIEPITMILLSGVVDFGMGLIIFFLYRRLKQSNYFLT